MKALALKLTTRTNTILSSDRPKEALALTDSKDFSAITTPSDENQSQSSALPPKVAQAIAEMRGQVRSTLLFLQLVILGVVACGAIINFNVLEFDHAVWLPITCLLAVF